MEIIMSQNTLSQKLRELRKLNNFTQDYVASALGIARQTYSHYETGKRTPDAKTIFVLSGIFKVPIDDLMQLTMDIDRNVCYDAPASSKSSQELYEFLEYFNKPANQKKYINNTYSEKRLLYYFEKLSDIDKDEIIEFTKIKAKKY